VSECAHITVVERLPPPRRLTPGLFKINESN